MLETGGLLFFREKDKERAGKIVQETDRETAKRKITNPLLTL